MEPIVEPADRGSAPILAALNLRTAIAGYGHIFPPEAPPPTHEELTQMWEHWLGADWEAGRRAFVARAGHDVVGVVLAGPDPATPRLGHLARLYVEPERWGLGIGRSLYRAALDHMAAAGFELITLWVLERNDKARDWYERLGWEPTGERKLVYEPAGIEDLQYSVAISPTE